MMKRYPQNSPQAAARILALSMLADGELEPSELTSLRLGAATSRLGLTRDAFNDVLEDFCADLMSNTWIDASGNCVVTPVLMREIFSEVDDPHLRNEIARLIGHVIRADSRLHYGESVMLQTLIHSWPSLGDESKAPPRRRRAVAMAE
ncbi:MAG: hypothetical protein QM776_07435 [Rhodocyclaceae bacterium]